MKREWKICSNISCNLYKFNGFDLILGVIVEHIQEQSFEIGYDALTDSFCNMYERGVVDPAKVSRSALQNAASIASMILTTECIIVES